MQTSQRKSDSTSQEDAIAILLIDDDPDCRLLIRDAIDASKVSNCVYEVSNGLEALEFLNRCGQCADMPKPGLIFLDVEMPGMGGQETLRAGSRHAVVRRHADRDDDRCER